MATTTYWTWIVECDEPGTGRRIASEGEVLAPLDATEQEIRQRLFPDLTAELQRRYGAGFQVEDLAPSCRFDRK
ncbi:MULTISPECIES: hypothetical protein [unclassified Streptomyces]|uniref:hypothetical protein n=1 Tax=unclassified Streptomyces TaxID=2593676 RepID=UPI0011E658B3|nr:hypothetical protein [Streptomyces sp. sk2.1]TXS78681.1 hypothetical protein EAO76_09995 [Streptomyces sp. sk2.1]